MELIWELIKIGGTTILLAWVCFVMAAVVHGCLGGPGA